MNAHETNTLSRTLLSIARAGAKPVARELCSQHRRDDLGWPLGNCIECQDYRKKMDAWYMEQVFDGNHDPDLIDHRVELDSDKGVA